MDDMSLAELEQHIVMHRSRVLQAADGIKALLADDLAKFVEREMKRAFVTTPEFAGTIDDSALKELKADLASRGPAAAASVIEALDEEGLWFPSGVTADDERKSIDENEALWAVVSRIGDAIVAIKEKYGFPDAGEPVTYRPPTWFIGGRYLPSLSERYWRHLRELAEAASAAGSIRAAHAKTELSRRWEQN